MLLVLFLVGILSGVLVSKHPLVFTNALPPNPPPEIQDPHRYGRVVTQQLPWELDPGFIKAIHTYNTPIRIAAFQTTLPDPLPGEEYNVSLAARILSGTLLQPGKVFSMNSQIGPYSMKQGFQQGPTYVGPQVFLSTGGGVCKIASTLYNVAILANTTIVERHPHSMLVPYVPAGQDATVYTGVKDFRFKNNYGFPILIWSQTKGNTLFIAFYGLTKPPEIKWRHQILNRQKTYKVYRYNKNLSPGEEKIVVPGADGMLVKSWITITESNGISNEKYLGADYYRPLPYVIERGRPQHW